MNPLTMNHYSGNLSDFGMDTISLARPLEAKLQAVRAAQWLGEDVLRRSVPLPNQMRLQR